jgi:hypothetical protein
MENEAMTDTDRMPTEIATALAACQAEIRRVGHDGQHQQQGYRYTSAEALLEATRDARAKAGLAIVQCGWDRLEGSRLSVRYLLAHKSGVSWELPRCTVPVVITTSARGNQTAADKAEAAALTYSLGYTLRGLLLIPRSDADDDVDQREDAPIVSTSSADVAMAIEAFGAVTVPAELETARAIGRAAYARASAEERQAIKAASDAAAARVA